MLDIRIDGEPADLMPGTSLTLERFSPLLDFEQIQGSRVYGFDLPNTPTNRKLLGYFNQPQAANKSRKFRCEKYMYGNMLEEGYVRISQANDDVFSLNFTQDLGQIFGDRQTLLLSQLGLGLDAPVPFANANHLTDRYCFPTIGNNSFYGNVGVAGYNGLMNEYTSAAYNPVAQVPMFFLKWVFTQFGLLTGWQFKGQFWQDPNLVRLILYNLFSLDGQTTINSNNHLPDLTMPQLVIDLRKLFNLYLEFDIRSNVLTMDFADDVLTSGEILDWTEKASPANPKTPDLVNRLELSYQIDSNDGLLKPVPAEMDIYTTPLTDDNAGGTTLPISSRLSTLLTDVATGRAITQQAGISPSNKDNKNNSTPKVLFWNGLVNGVPTATNASGNRKLVWHGDNNLVVRGYTGFQAFKQDTFSLTKLVYLTPSDLATYSFRKKIHIKGVNYVVGSMKAVLSMDQRTVPTELGLWRA